MSSAALPGVPRLFVGMLPLGPLPGSPRFRGSLGEVAAPAVADAHALAEGGFSACLGENFGDSPFLLVGSGMTTKAVWDLRAFAAAVIVGTWVKPDGWTSAPWIRPASRHWFARPGEPGLAPTRPTFP